MEARLALESRTVTDALGPRIARTRTACRAKAAHPEGDEGAVHRRPPARRDRRRRPPCADRRRCRARTRNSRHLAPPSGIGPRRPGGEARSSRREGAVLEWLPQGTIVFDGAQERVRPHRARTRRDIWGGYRSLSAAPRPRSAFGRANGGSASTSFAIAHSLERAHPADGGGLLLSSRVGLNGAPVLAHSWQ